MYILLWSACWLQISIASSVNWIDRPDDFLAMFVSCIRDKHCHFYYWHLTKTGGTTITYNFKRVFPKIFKRNSCCGDIAVRNFKKNVEAYCHSKFSSFEVPGEDMRMIVETCMKINPRSSSIFMFTFREPISRFISWINELCNKKKKRSVEWQRVCERCTYAPDTKTTLQLKIEQANKQYLSASYFTEMNLKNVQVLTLDTKDLSGFLETPSLQSDFNVTSMLQNPEKKTKCDFGITSSIIRELAPSIGVYRNLTRGAN